MKTKALIHLAIIVILTVVTIAAQAQSVMPVTVNSTIDWTQVLSTYLGLSLYFGTGKGIDIVRGLHNGKK